MHTTQGAWVRVLVDMLPFGKLTLICTATVSYFVVLYFCHCCGSSLNRAEPVERVSANDWDKPYHQLVTESSDDYVTQQFIVTWVEESKGIQDTLLL